MRRVVKDVVFGFQSALSWTSKAGVQEGDIVRGLGVVRPYLAEIAFGIWQMLYYCLNVGDGYLIFCQFKSSCGNTKQNIYSRYRKENIGIGQIL